jgi:hypothetical protein
MLLDHFVEGFEVNEANSHELYYLNRMKQTQVMVNAFAAADHVLLAHPLYTDAMPGIVKAFIEALEPLSGREDNPKLGFLVQSGFGEANHSKYIARYHKKLATRLRCPYLGTIIKGDCDRVQRMPHQYKAIFKAFHRLGKSYGETGIYDEELVQKLGQPEKFSPVMRFLIKSITRIVGTGYFDDQLKENEAYEKRFDRPFEKSARS